MAGTDWHYWNVFVSEISDAAEDLGCPDSAWYRGVTAQNHTLIPSLLRLSGGASKERSLFERYVQIASGMYQRPNRSALDWDTLFEMQHYHVPTRLLDWTEVLGVAVFFALLSPLATDRYVYVLNPSRLNEKQGKQELIGEWDRENFGYRPVFWDGNPFKPNLPLAINPSHTNPRLSAQRGRFTIHGVDAHAIDQSAPDCIRKIKLPSSAVPAAKAFLLTAGIDEFRIFPDVAGAAPFLKSLVGL